MEDLWELPPEVSSKNVVPKFNKHWDATRIAAAEKQAIIVAAKKKAEEERVQLTDVAFKKEVDDAKVVDGSEKKKKKKEEDEKKKSLEGQVSVFPALVKAFGMSFLTGSILKLVHDIMVFIAPTILRLIIQFASSDEPLWRGIFFAALLLLSASIQSIMLSQYFYKMYMIGLWTRSALISALYRKSLKVSQNVKKNITTGEVVNLMSVDVQRVVDMMPYINMVWSAPLQIAGAIFFLWQQLGPSVLSGLAVMILLIPLNGAIAAKGRSYQIRQMKEKDQRVKMMNEILSGIKILKLYAWEPSFEKLVTNIRSKEIKILKRMGYLQAGSSFIWSCAPFVVSLVTFATYVLSDPNNILDSEKAFVSLALFNILRFPMSMLPMMIAGVVQCSVAIKRMNKYFNCEELESGLPTASTTRTAAPPREEDAEKKKSAIEVENASFTWDVESEKPTLQDVNLNIKRGSLVAVVGAVGMGKSSLISALLGELEKISGSVTLRGNVAYVAQQAWIQNSTLKQNILFGKAVDETRYQSVIEDCALESDLKMLPAGDKTEIGEKGINLSGGQKQRVSLARACYSQSDIYLLDDPLSAVDAHVGKHIFDRVLSHSGNLGSKTRILVTHSVSYLPQMDNIIVLKDGVISESGTYTELLENRGAFAEFLVQYLSEEDSDETTNIKMALEEKIGKNVLQEKLARARSESESQQQTADNNRSGSPIHSEKNGSALTLERSNSVSPTKAVAPTSSSATGGPRRSRSNTAEKTPPPKAQQQSASKPSNSKQYQDERSEQGKVSLEVYFYYIKNMGYFLFLSCVACYTLYQIFSAFSSIWLSSWSDSYANGNHTTSQRDMYLGVYGGLGLGQGVAAVIGSLFLYLATLRGACRLHNLMLSNVLKSPMSFFDTTPQGRILNRFGKDVDVLDASMAMMLRGWITCLLAVVATFIVITYTTPVFLVPIVFILICYYFVQRVYVATSRELKRLESTSRSPIYSHFGETVMGVQTIRAYRLEEQFIDASEKKVDYNQKACWPSIVANRWLAVRLETVGNIIIFCAALFAVIGRDHLSPGMVGLSVSYALSVTQTLNWLVRMSSEIETNIVAAERLKEYAETDTEAEWKKDDVKLAKNWPHEGKIKFVSYSMRYRDGLDLVLDSIDFSVDGGKRVGIVGRTGAGKSSLTLALFRMIEPAGGKIIIDGVDISTLGLHDLRAKLTIIPQDPVLFSGSLRMNLDPFDHFTDAEVWRALELAHLKDFVETNLTDGLTHIVAEGGENLSVGQRQLICLARALLRKTKVLILDEATAAVDMETDDLIQQTIKCEFNDCTVLTIAHRLNTILDYDQILVLDKGKVAEYDGPQNLLKDKESKFFGMCKEAGLA